MMWRKALMLGVLSGLAAPAPAQFYLKSQGFPGAPVQGDEPGMIQPLADATPVERRAALAWSMRAALNVAALQCQFEPTLLTTSNYNALLKDHGTELKTSFDTLTKYFLRVGKSKPKGQSMLDQFGTRTYSSFVTVGGQFAFCQTAASIGRDAVFTPRGSFGQLSANRMAELRASLQGAFSEQGVGRLPTREALILPRLDAICWNKKGEWVAKKCGPQNWPPA